MHSLESQLRERSSSELQHAILRNELVYEAAELAKAILKERGAAVPTPMEEAELEAEQQTSLRRSNAKFWVFAFTVVGWFAYATAFDLFAQSNGARLRNSVFVTGLLLAIELGFVKFGGKK